MNRRTALKQQNELYSVCKKINECARLVKLCDAVIRDNRGLSKSPKHVMAREIRAILDLPDKASVSEYKAERDLRTGVVSVFNRSKQLIKAMHQSQINAILSEKEINQKLLNTNGGYGFSGSMSSGGIGSNYTYQNQINSQNKSNLLKVLENLVALVKLITATTATLAAIKEGTTGAVSVARQGAQTLRGIGSKIGGFINTLRSKVKK